jgi:hypothetical protein
MNALAAFRSWIGGSEDKATSADLAHKRYTIDRSRWASHFDRLSPEQQAAVLAYEGDDTVGDVAQAARLDAR